MAEQRSKNQWNHTASLLQQTANLHRGKDSPPIGIEVFHPYLSRADVDETRPEEPKMHVSILRDVFCKEE